jgi:ADP-ribose pyrophosphatase YjhB (NUDIX family)
MVNKKDLKPFDLRKYPIVPLIGVGVMFVRDSSLLLVKRKFDPDAGYWAW